MGLYLNPSNRLFQMMLNGKFYVDKTGLASFMNERLCGPERFACVSRPRRFGKSADDRTAQDAYLDFLRDAAAMTNACTHAQML